MKKFLVYDDEGEMQNRLCEKLRGLESLRDAFDIIPLEKDAFLHTMEILKTRQNAFRENGRWDGEKIPLDETAFFVIDYDLLRNPLDSFLTGEAVAYLTRCFSTCGLIIGINQPPLIDFVLTLQGRPASFADLNITEKNLNNPGLWGGEWQGFRPWYWPNLPGFWASFERRIADVKEALDAPIWEVLGFDRYTFDVLPRSISDFLGSEPAEVTFREFVRKSGNALKVKDAKSDDCAPEVLSRVAAARISKWLERLVLPGQDILVDAPHLVSRFPSLISGDAGDIGAWNTTARLGSHDEAGLDAGIIEEYRLKNHHWLSRPVWFWDGLRSCERIQEVREPWTVQMPDWVFCEDASAFDDRDKTASFVAETESPYSRRSVRRFAGYDYRPFARFSA